jgi:hypothetical protein
MYINIANLKISYVLSKTNAYVTVSIDTPLEKMADELLSENSKYKKINYRNGCQR